MARKIDLKNLDLTEIIRPGDAVVWGQSSGEPLSLVEKLVEQRKQIGHAWVFCAQSYTKTLRPEHDDALEITSYCAIGTRPPAPASSTSFRCSFRTFRNTLWTGSFR